MAQIALTACNGKRLVLIGGLARAGKSFAAQVLKESLCALGREAHVISLDGWLKSKDQRSEGAGVCNRYDLKTASMVIEAVVRSERRDLLREQLYDRATHKIGRLEIEHSIGPEDILIVEGVPALLLRELTSLTNAIKVFIDLEPTIRNKRLSKDYKWRAQPNDKYANTLAMRELDETPVVMQSRSLADFII
jgi:uridine kinase